MSNASAIKSKIARTDLLAIAEELTRWSDDAPLPADLPDLFGEIGVNPGASDDASMRRLMIFVLVGNSTDEEVALYLLDLVEDGAESALRLFMADARATRQTAAGGWTGERAHRVAALVLAHACGLLANEGADDLANNLDAVI